MKILLVGGLGFIGRRFIQKFSNNYELAIYAKKDTIHDINREFLRDITIEEGLVEEEKLCNFVKKYRPDVVVHLAAMTGLKRCQENPDKTFQTNVYGTFNVIKSCLEVGSRLVFASSFEAYGRTEKYESEESDILNPTNTYAITKMLGEELVKHANRLNDLDYVILRISNVYGPDYNRGINAMLKSAIEENKISIHGVNRFRNFLYIDDAVEMLDLIIRDKRSSNQIFNIGSENTFTLKEIAEKISTRFKHSIRLEDLPEINLESNYRPSLKKAASFGYSAKTSFDEGLENTIRWYLNNKK